VVRPTWLLTEPEPLPERRSRPLLGGQPLQLLSGPERIEAGWWDSGLAERDYFIAQAADGALVWIYRARLPLSAGEGRQGWFMQGRFG
jgi:protein ImuB